MTEPLDVDTPGVELVAASAAETRAAQARNNPVVNARNARCRSFLSNGMRKEIRRKERPRTPPAALLD
jgi:hypothetical protein